MTTTIEASHEAAMLFRHWLHTGRSNRDVYAALVVTVRPHAGDWLVGSDYVFRLAVDEGRESLEWEKRSKALEMRGAG